MKKTFYQFHFMAILSCVICFAIAAFSIYLIVFDWTENNILGVVIGVCSLAIVIYSYITTFNYRLIFYDDYIEITGHLGKENDKIQCHDKVVFSDIQNVKIVYSTKNSQKKRFAWNDIGNITPKLYFEFIFDNQASKWVHIDSFSKRQRKQMLNIINQKTGAHYIYEELVNTSVAK